MDVFSHGLWAGAVYKGINKSCRAMPNGRQAGQKERKPFKVKWAFLWGVFPDVFAFVASFGWLLFNSFSGGEGFGDFHQRVEGMEPAVQDTLPIMKFTAMLYNISHSLFIFFVVFGLVRLIFKRPVWEMGAWLLHILMDIPTHSYRFYPTPFLWPFSDWKFDGFSWGTLWFIVPNYLILIVVYILLRKSKKKKEPLES